MEIREGKVVWIRTLILVAASITIFACLLFANWQPLHAALTAKTWDGGGATNNWSEAANWSDDIVPVSGDIVTFDGTSTKDATIDTDISVFGLQINSGYTGAVTQSNSAAVTVGGNDLIINAGTYNGSSNTITINSNGFGALTVNGGTFNGGSGDITLTGDSNSDHALKILSGTFNSTNGTLFLDRGFQHENGAVFNSNSGTVTFFGSQNTAIQGSSPGTTFNNLNFSKDPGTEIDLAGRANVVIGSLALNEGTLNSGSVEARGGMAISPAFDGGSTSLILANGSGPRTFTLTAGLSLPRIVVSDPNATINTSGIGTLEFPHQLELQQGTVNQGNVDLLIGPRLGGGACFVQGGGIFNGSSKSITLNSNGFGAFSQSGGSFNAVSGNIDLIGTSADLTVTGGTFTSTSGTLTASASFRIQGGSFVHNGGTVSFTGSGNPSIDVLAFVQGVTVNNLIFNRDNGTSTFLFGKFIVIGTLSLTDGGFNNSGTIEVRSGMTIAGTFDGGGPNNLLIANGTGPRTFTFDTSLALPFVTLNDPNVTLNTSGTGTLNFPRAFALQQGVFNQGNVDLDFFPVVGGGSSYTQTGGSFNGSLKTVTFTSDGFGGFSQSGGLFNAGGGDIALIGTGSTFTISGGTFTSTPGVLMASSDFRIQGGTFNHNNGTVAFTGGGSPTIDVSAFASGLTFKNVNFNRDNGSGTFLFGKIITIGTISLIEGGFTNNGIIEVRSGLNIASTFDGGGPNNLLIANGSGPRVFTFDTSLTLPFVTLDDTNVTLNTSGSGTLNWPHGFRLQHGVFNQGNVDLDFFPVPGGSNTPYSQSGGTFNGSSNSIIAIGNGFGGFSQSGGLFNAGSGDITLNGTGSTFTISGGTFNSTSGILTASTDFRIQGGTFNHNNGTVAFTGGGSPTIDVSAFAAGVTFSNVNFNRDNGAGTFLFGKMITAGTLALNDGGFTNNGTIEAQGNVSIAGTFDGGGPNNFTFGGAAVQTFTNNGAPNPPGIWTLNKTGGTVNLASNLDLSNGAANVLNLTAGTISTGIFELNAATRTIARTAGYISGNLRRDFSTAGIKTYDVGTANAYAPVSVNVVAPIAGTQGLTVGEFQGAHPNLNPAISLGRFWTLTEHGTVTANLTFNYIDPLDISGSETAYRAAQIDSLVNFFTEAQIPINRPTNSFTINNVTDFKTYTLGQPTVTISPANISLPVQGTQTFVGSGGTAPYSYIMAANNSFGGVDPVTGLYTAGTHAGVTDSVKVTDSEGRIAFATINVQPGAATKLAFGLPLNTVNINTPISPGPLVVIQDQFANPVTTASDPVTISISSNPGSGTLSGTLTQNAVNGVATFSDLSINSLGNGYTLAASSGPLTPATSTGFNVLGPAQLAFFNEQAVNPIIQNTPFTLQVEVQDQFGQRFQNATNSITLAIANNPGGGTLSGVTSQNASNGLAAFTGLSIDAPGNGYTFSANSTSLTPSTSLSYNVVSPFVVTNKTDGLPGSLRSTIIAANAAPGTQTISFNIPGPPPYDIVLSTPLPAITDTVIIDGTTQPGFAGSPIIEIDGRNVVGNVAGIALQASNNSLRGLSVTRFNSQFSSGISVSPQANNNTIQGNWVGLSPTGTAAGNGNGIFVTSRDNLIGGPNPSDRNVISGNLSFGLDFGGANKPNTVQGNYIGTNAAGTAPMGNKTGILMSGSDTVKENVISGNMSDGVNSTSDPNNLIENNLIGLDASGSTIVGNGGSGINLGTSVGSGNRITSNRIFGNGLLGIKLGNRTVTAAGPPLPNDPGDNDSGANGLQNYPVLNTIAPVPGSTSVSGIMNSVKNAAYTLEFFSSPTCDASGNGEGANFLGSAVVNTDTSGNANFNVNLPATISTTDFVTATATDSAGNTSEFSACKGPQATILGTIKTAGGQPIQSVSLRLTNTSTGVVKFSTTDSLGAYQFKDQPLGQNYTVTPSKANLIFSPPSATHNNLSADQIDAFIGSVQTFTISGKATRGSATLSGVTMTLSGGANASIATNSIGNFSFPNLPAGNYTVTPSLQNFNFSPASSMFTIIGNQTANFAAINLLANLPGKIAFVSSGGISRMNADGSGATLIIPNTQGFTYLSPVLSKNGSKLAYIEHAVGGPGTNTLKVSNADGSSPVSLTQLNSGQSNFGLAWSPDQSIVTACKTVNGIVRLVNVTVANGVVTSILGTGTTNEQPVWSPDGTKIAFSRDDTTTTGNGRSIFTVNADGTGLVKLTNPLIIDSLPTWSPDGTKLAFIRSLNGIPTEVFVMNANGSGQSDVFSVPITEQLSDIGWAPDGSRLAVITRSGTAQRLVSILPDGTGELVISSNLGGTAFDWGPTPFVLLPIGNPININVGRVIINFPSVPLNGAGSPTLTVEPITPASLGDPPQGFVFGNFGYDISTDGTFTPPVTVCFDLPPDAYPNSSSFNELSLLHFENGLFIDVTSSRDLANFRLCGQSSTLGSFVVAEHSNMSLPSIKGIVVDQNGDPVDDITLSLTGDSEHQATTDANGVFGFVNLVQGGNYVLTPTTIGHTYNAPFAGFLSLNGEQTAVFVATRADFGISGTVTDQSQLPTVGVTISLSGTVDVVTTTDADGNYSFAQLPAGGSYVVTPSVEGSVFFPNFAPIDSLQDDLTNVNFNTAAFSQGPFSVGGRIVGQNGSGLSQVSVVLTGSEFSPLRTAKTNPFGYYRFDNVPGSQSYTVSVSSKRFDFANPSQVINVIGDLTDLNFVGAPR